MTEMDKDCDTYNEYVCIYGQEIVSSLYCFPSNSDVGLVENVAENIQGKSLPNSGCYKSKKVSMFLILTPL